MRAKAFAWALLYGAAALFASPATAQGPDQTRMADAARALGGELSRLAFHASPRPPVTAEFAAPDGARASFADFAGKITLVNFWATWCPPCRKEMPSLDRLRALAASDEVEVVAVNVERRGRKKAAEFFAQNGIDSLAPYADETGALPPEMGILGIPVTVILDREGREIARLQGEARWDAPEVVALLRELAQMTRPGAG
ncbi:TlpA family protein disulfide reductase [Oceanicella actignis]|uniref:TlpA family protein disulfide reductase n=1 Tax=Oceanicella actignis TaxID=1189325 RepID=UPI0011E8681A|nr:TlpA family protein disulfide reductase [Oceanicella actignis]TYO90863.1 thiol-disulfide isomerase/thioredoxin [Oceanicella actignis]